MSENRIKRAKGVSVIVTMDASTVRSIRKGDTVYTAYVSTEEKGYSYPATARWEASLTPYRKNLSREECVDGWCGSTDGVNVNAQGSAHVTQIFKAPAFGYDCIAADHVDQKVRVRLDADAIQTFTFAANVFRPITSGRGGGERRRRR
jgi:hypothetical protein